MRRGSQNGLILTPSGEVHTLCFGADYCAEHEWGIRRILEAFGVRPLADVSRPDGVKKRTVTKVPSKEHLGLYNFKTDPARTLLCFQDYTHKIRGFGDCPSEIRAFYEREGPHLATAWDEHSFGACASGDNRKMLRDVYQALLDKDAFFYFAASLPVFENPGLCIGIASRVPAKVSDGLRELDVSQRELSKAAAATGIEDVQKRLRAAGKKWFAMSPAWKDREQKTVRFWLNPMEQHLYNYGWFEVEDFEAWIRGEGRIVKK